jgi:hypothetical protein
LASLASLLNLVFDLPRVCTGEAFLTAGAPAAIALKAGNKFNACDYADSMTVLAGVL